MREKEGYRFGRISIINHWTVAIIFLGVLALGFYLEFAGSGRGQGGPWMGGHKAAGVILLIIALWRIIWRLLQGFPKDTVHIPAWQDVAAKGVHWVLFFAIVAMPISGILMSVYGDRAINVFGLFIIPVQPENEMINRLGDAFHWYMSYIVAAVILMHVAGALKHHFIDKDDTLKRMLSSKIPKDKKAPVKR